MAQGKDRHSLHPRTSCISPLWKHSTSKNVTLRMRPPQTPFTSLDTFMAAHSPRRFCQARQKYILKPLTLDKRITESGFAPVQKEARTNSGVGTGSNSNHQKLCYSHINRHVSNNSTSASTTDSSSEGEHNTQRVLALGKCRLNNEEIVSNGPCDPYRSAFFRPGPKVPIIFNRTSSIPTMPQDNSDLIAIGTIPVTSQRQTPVKPMSRSSSEEDIQLVPKAGSLWKTKATLNLKGCKYPDPMIGAGASFQARITEMAQLEVETIRCEKTKKTKKKASSS